MSQDSCLRALAVHLSAKRNTLWLAGEGANAVIPLLRSVDAQLLTNRFDLAEAAKQAGLKTQFNDWQPDLRLGFDDIFLRLTKEKPTNLHLANMALHLLKPGGHFYLGGQKNEGIKSFANTLLKGFDVVQPLKKQGDNYLAIFSKQTAPSKPAAPTKAATAGRHNQSTLTPTSETSIALEETTFDSQQYASMRSIGELDRYPLYSKPGVYGWNKIDAGSELLMQTLQERGDSFKPGQSLLDLGCGYGYLTLASKSLPFSHRVATDNNAAAISCTRHNARAHEMEVQVIAGDCANTIKEQFDAIFCNPPFHTGFDVNSGLTAQFVAAASNKLTPEGSAYFVVNRFIALEKKAEEAFKAVHTIASNNKFKVLALSKPR